jgi:hypothetical protein
VRHDGGWIPSDQNPQAGIAIYNSSDVELQNAVVIDSTLWYPGWLGGITHVQNTLAGTLSNAGVRVRGSIVLNVSDVGVSYEGNGDIADAGIADSVIWKVARSALTLNGGSHSVTAERLTVGDVADGNAFNVFGGAESTLTVDHSIVYRGANRAFNQRRGRLTEGNNTCFPRSGSTDCVGPGDTVVDPRANGLISLTRLEAGSALAAAGRGARITTRIGKSGSLFGSPGFDTYTSEDLWPWPNQDRLRSDFCEDGVVRGMCGTALSFTDYIWSFLGPDSPVRR